VPIPGGKCEIKILHPYYKTHIFVRCWWLTTVILANQGAEIRGYRFKAILGKWFERPYLKKTHHKKRAGGVAQGMGPEFKPQYHIHTYKSYTFWYMKLILNEH
jgi:hypothetical protein